jgi:hypothetical protein
LALLCFVKFKKKEQNQLQLSFRSLQLSLSHPLFCSDTNLIETDMQEYLMNTELYIMLRMNNHLALYSLYNTAG